MVYLLTNQLWILNYLLPTVRLQWPTTQYFCLRELRYSAVWRSYAICIGQYWCQGPLGWRRDVWPREQGFPVPYNSLTFHGLGYHSRMHSFGTDISLVTVEERSIQPSCQNASASLSRALDGSKVEPSSNFQPPTRNSSKSHESSQVQQAMHVTSSRGGTGLITWW